MDVKLYLMNDLLCYYMHYKYDLTRPLSSCVNFPVSVIRQGASILSQATIILVI